MNGAPVTLRKLPTCQEEIDFVVDEIARIVTISKGVLNYSDIGILVRVRSMFKRIHKALERRGIPYHAETLLPLTEDQEVGALLAYLRLAENGSDNASFNIAVNTPSRRIPQNVLKMIAEAAKVQKRGCYEVLHELINGRKFLEVPFIGREALGGLTEFHMVVENLRLSLESPIADILTKLIEDLNSKFRIQQNYNRQTWEEHWSNVQGGHFPLTYFWLVSLQIMKNARSASGGEGI